MSEGHELMRTVPVSDDFELVGFDPNWHKGTNFSGWLSASKRRVVFVSRMYHAQSVMNDGDYYNSTPETIGENYGFQRGRISSLMPEEIYDLMFSEGWVRFYSEHGVGGQLVMEGKDEALKAARSFAKAAGFSDDQLRLRKRESYDDFVQRL